MTHEDERDELVDLGAVSVETRGPSFGRDDTAAGLIPVAGLTDE